MAATPRTLERERENSWNGAEEETRKAARMKNILLNQESFSNICSSVGCFVFLVLFLAELIVSAGHNWLSWMHIWKWTFHSLLVSHSCHLDQLLPVKSQQNRLQPHGYRQPQVEGVTSRSSLCHLSHSEMDSPRFVCHITCEKWEKNVIIGHCSFELGCSCSFLPLDGALVMICA